VRFASCAHDGRRFAALVDGDVVRPLREIAGLGRDTPSEVLADPPLSEERHSLREVALLPVVPHPGKIICMGLNYREHVAEGAYDVPDFPVLFSKFRETLLAAASSRRSPRRSTTRPSWRS
jgi:acylpyruvate hydrolase